VGTVDAETGVLTEVAPTRGHLDIENYPANAQFSDECNRIKFRELDCMSEKIIMFLHVNT
jgi:hypothetical protein